MSLSLFQADNFNYDGFIIYLKTLNKKKDTAKSIAKDVALYLNGAEENSTAQLLSLSELEKFLMAMKEEMSYKPSTRKNKLKSLQLAIKFVIRSIDNQRLYYIGQRALDSIDDWCSGLGKDISIQRREYGLLAREKMKDMPDPNEFLNDETVRNLYCAKQ